MKNITAKKGITKKDKVISMAEALVLKFIAKVEAGTARSTDTYNDCKVLLEEIKKIKG